MNEAGYCSPLLIETKSCTDMIVFYINCQEFIVTVPPNVGEVRGGDVLGDSGYKLTFGTGDKLDSVGCTC